MHRKNKAIFLESLNRNKVKIPRGKCLVFSISKGFERFFAGPCWGFHETFLRALKIVSWYGLVGTGLEGEEGGGGGSWYISSVCFAGNKRLYGFGMKRTIPPGRFGGRDYLCGR